MRTRLLLVLILSLAAPNAWAAAEGGSDAFHLKPGAKGKVCLGCHTQFEETLKRPFVHTPVKAGDCSACHNPHASSHGKLLQADPNKVCATCHADIVPAGTKSAHPDAVEGNCVKCHDPHGSANKSLLVASGNGLCFTCHKEMGTLASEAKHKHGPVTKSCLTCHRPHASRDVDHLMAKAVPALCSDCHKPDQPAFLKSHMGYPVGKSNCVSCHDPHGSNQPGILWASVHPPVAERKCAQCHQEAGSSDPLKVRRQGLETCRGCHSEMMNKIFDASRIHWPLLGREACLSCHRPHASKAGKLLADQEIKLCARCHSRIASQAQTSTAKHQPVADGDCTTCHAPHASNTAFLFTASDTVSLCGTCHDWGQHSAHPMGPTVVDQRNKNLSVDCVSCHDVHGSPHKYITWEDKKMDLCVSCHQDFRR